MEKDDLFNGVMVADTVAHIIGVLLISGAIILVGAIVLFLKEYQSIRRRSWLIY